MRRSRSPLMKTRYRQRELVERRPTLPAWEVLPEECRREVEQLLIRLLQEAQDGLIEADARPRDE